MIKRKLLAMIITILIIFSSNINITFGLRNNIISESIDSNKYVDNQHKIITVNEVTDREKSIIGKTIPKYISLTVKNSIGLIFKRLASQTEFYSQHITKDLIKNLIENRYIQKLVKAKEQLVKKGGCNEAGNLNSHTYLSVETGGRSVVTYKDKSSIYLSGKSFILSGFRFLGQYTKSLAPIVTFPERIVANLNRLEDLGCQTEKDFDNWYAVFAVSDNGIAKIKIMPFFSVHSTNKNIVTLSEAGEIRNTGNVKTYSINTNALVNSDVLVITETLGENKLNAFSGRITKVVANTNQSITLDNIETIGVGDWLLPSPPGFSDYRYLSSFYLDESEVRNIFDSGSKVTTRGVAITTAAIDGDMSVGKYIDVQGFIPPLASAVIFNIKETVSSSSTGTHNFTIGGDSTHDFYTCFNRKDTISTTNIYESGIEAPFQFSQKVYFKSSGSIGTVPTRQFDVRGWIES